MSEVEGGDYELAKAVESGTQQVLIPAIKDMGETLEKVSSSVGEGADRVADTAMEADATAEQGLHDAEQGLDGAPTEGGVNPNEGTTASGGGQKTPTNGSGPTQDDFGGGDEGGSGSEGVEDTPTDGDPVDVVSGQMVTLVNDVELPGVLPLSLRRAYASGYRHGGLFGPGWSSSLDQRLVIDANGIHYLGDDAQILNYQIPTQPGQQVYPKAGAQWPLSWDRSNDVIRLVDTATGHTRIFPAARRSVGDGEVRSMARLEDRNGNWIQILRDDQDAPAEVIHHGGYRVLIESSFYGGSLRVDGIRVRSGAAEGARLRSFRYDPLGRLVEVMDSAEMPYTYEYDRSDRITAWIDRNGHRYEYAYDEQGRVVRGTGPDGFLSAGFEYDVDRRVTTVTNSLGFRTEYAYDEQNHLVSVTDPLGNATRTEYDRFGRLVASSDQLGFTTRYTLDDQGDPIRIERPDGAVTTIEYDGDRQPTLVAKPGEGTWLFEYDGRANLTAEVDPAGVRTRYAYDDRGAVCMGIDGEGQIVRVETNAAGLPVAITDRTGATVRYARDGLGNITRIDSPSGTTTSYGWSMEGRPLWRIGPDGVREERAYDAEGNLVELTGRLGDVTRFERLSFGLPGARVGSDGARLEFTYDSEQQVVAVLNALGETWTYAYDPGGNLIAETDFGGRTVRYEHDAAGRVVRRANAGGSSIRYLRNELGLVTELTTEDGSTTELAYDAAGRLIRAANPSVELAYTHDALGRVLTETVNDQTLANTYDVLGRRAERRTPSGMTSRWAYGSDDRLESMTTAGHTISIGHDAAGRETYRWIDDKAAITHAWDTTGRLVDQSILAVSGLAEARTSTVVRQYGWQYRADDTPRTVGSGSRGAVALDLDQIGRITGARGSSGFDETYSFDLAGNLTSATTTANSDTDGDRVYERTLLRRAGRTTYDYDADGRLTKMTRRTLSGGQKTWEYRYNSFDQLIEAVTPTGDRWRYVYDALGRRHAKQRLAADGTVLEETRFVWDGQTLAEEIRSAESSPTVTTTWEFEPGTWRPMTQSRLSQVAGSREVVDEQRFHAIVCDVAGAPRELVEPAGGVHWTRRATVWGGWAGAEPTGLECLLGFQGQYFDAETGFYYNLHRYYDPENARFSTPDPLGLEPSINHYAYAPNPMVWIDPLGLALHRTPPWLDEGDLRSGWIHIDARHITGNHPAGRGNLFPSGTSRDDIRAWSEDTVATGTRVSDPARTLQTFEKRMKIGGRNVRFSVTVDSHNGNRIITAYPCGKDLQ